MPGRASASSSRGICSIPCGSVIWTRFPSRLAAETGLPHRYSVEGEQVAGVYRQRVTLASGRFAKIDDGLGFQLVPWRPALEQRLGQHISGTMTGRGVDWNFGRGLDLGI